jgi:hypothetical protein
MGKIIDGRLSTIGSMIMITIITERRW